jgi:hypothetical protein
MTTLGFFTVVHNDPENLRALLDSIPWAGFFDQVVVVHDGPDVGDCLAVARRYTDNAIATLYRQGWGKAVYQIAMQLMTTDWVFHLDADERPLQDTWLMLPTLVRQAEAESEEAIDAWKFLRLESDGRISEQTRLFKMGAAHYLDIPHTQVQGITNPVLTLPPEGHLYHIDHSRDPGDLARAGRGEDWPAFAAKMVRYARVQEALRTKYGPWHPELLAPGQALGIDYSIVGNREEEEQP